MTDTHDLIATGLDELIARTPTVPDGVAVDRLYDGPGLRLRALAIDAGAALTDHVAGAPVLIQVLAGRVRLQIGGREHELTAGGIVRADAQEAHAVVALEESRLLLVLLG